MPLFAFKKRFSRRIRWLLRLLGLSMALLAAVLFAPRILPPIAMAQIGEITNTRITADNIKLKLTGWVAIENLAIRPHRIDPYDNTILRAEKVRARFSVLSLLMLHPRLQKVSVDGFTVNALYDLKSGRWNLDQFKLQGPKGGRKPIPKVSLRNGIVRYSKLSAGGLKVATEIPLDVDILPDSENPQQVSFNIVTAPEAGEEERNTLAGSWKPGHLILNGSVSSTKLPAFERTWDVDSIAAEFKYDAQQDFTLKLRIADLTGTKTFDPDQQQLETPAFLKKTGAVAALQQFFGQARPWGTIDIEVDASGNLENLAESKFRGQVICKDVYIWDRSFAYKLEHMTGRVRLTNETLELDSLRATHGDAVITIEGGGRKLAEGWQYDITMASPNMPLDDDLYQALTPGQQEFWAVFWPSGIMAFESRMTGDPAGGSSVVMTVTLNNIKATCAYFPYPLENITGSLVFGEKDIKFSDLHADFDNRQVDVHGLITFPEPRKPRYEIFVDVNDIPLDKTLEAALPPEQQVFYREFSPAGFGSGRVRVVNHPTDPNNFTFTADLKFRDGVLDANEFNLKITDIDAHAVFTPEMIEIKDLRGLHADGAMGITGRIIPGRDMTGHRYRLDVRGRNALICDELLGLIPEGIRDNVEDLNASGRLDYRAELDKSPGIESMNYKLTAQCLGNSMKHKTFFGYPMQGITGTVIADANRITMIDMKGAPADSVWHKSGRSQIRLDGCINIAADRFVDARVKLGAEEIFFEDQLAENLPEPLRPLYRRLNPTGSFDADFPVIHVTPAQNGDNNFDFEGDLIFHDCNFAVEGAQTKLDGTVHAAGSYKADRDGFTNGFLGVDAGKFVIKKLPLRNLTTTLTYDQAAGTWSSDRLTANLYDGDVMGTCQLTELADKNLQYLLQLAFKDVDLNRLLAETKFQDNPEALRTVGRINGYLNMQSVMGDGSSRTGVCRVTVDDMKLGKLPPLANLLSVLNLSLPPDFAFNDLFFDSYISGDSLYVRMLDLGGPAISFRGAGKVDLPGQNLHLILAARGKRLANDDPTVLQSLTEGIGQAVVRMEVTGSIYDPKVNTRTLPLLEDSFNILKDSHFIPLP